MDQLQADCASRSTFELGITQFKLAENYTAVNMVVWCWLKHKLVNRESVRASNKGQRTTFWEYVRFVFGISRRN